MKIFIIGPSGSGKTYLAEKLSRKLHIKHTNLDYVLFEHTVSKKREELPENEWRKKLQKILKEKSWIIEGVNPIKSVFEKADKIIYLKPGLTTSLFSQWKRYFTDPRQRREHGFINNLKLSKYLMKQYLQEPNPSELDNPKYSRVKKTDQILKRYKAKLIIFTSRKQVNLWLLGQ